MCSRKVVGFLLTVSAGVAAVAAVVVINVLPWDNVWATVIPMLCIVWIFLGPALGLLLICDDDEEDDGDDGDGSLPPAPEPVDTEIALLERLYAMPSPDPAHDVRARVFIFTNFSLIISNF